MAKNNRYGKLPNEEVLAERLRGEALAERPEFSEALHRRIARSVGQRREGEAVLCSRGTAAGRRRRRAAVFAAACAILAAAVCWKLVPGLIRFDSPVSEQQLVKNHPYLSGKIEDLPPLNALTDRAVAEADTLLASSGFKIPSRQFSDDARSLVDAFLRRIPIDEEEPEER
ncbi:MAG: hypothetical protein GX594_11135 [Pirellulaceae bacterium]|nr:hypothetical protein [Pirellulaceae bacterium]